MKKSKLIKISENINKNLKEALDGINELIQEAKRPNWTLTDSYGRISSAMSDIQGMLECEIGRSKEIKEAEAVYGFDSSMFDIEEDGGDK
ncbi:MAG: hypothetical protein IKT40_03770 [Bacilli bacterium]|nr:hypothetical protein [Bacilli bacterium]